ncbi:MAG TPA: cobalt-precorrin-5B (C(1))-methyltransferase [Desulfobulbaceae bacterium]|nr:cobalt-precorrin-5B (C(1))-methyltransferase [Desulfobulbaceae bacterium]
MTGKQKKLRSGFTTGACAAAAAKAASLMLLTGYALDQVEIPFPTGERHAFTLHSCVLQDGQVTVSIIKDAGDDPDVTNGAEIIAIVEQQDPGASGEDITILGGPGVGKVTKPGLPIPVGEAAINPVPREMIRAAVGEAMVEVKIENIPLAVTICVTDGELLAEKTLNSRLGIKGGLSILGTTGIVRPISASAWTDTIEASMKVARATGLTEVILSTGRTSEAAVQRILGLPEEAQVMMGDYLAYALKAARRHGFENIYLSGMWAKVLKCALGIPQTHVRHGALEVGQAAELLFKSGLDRSAADALATANTAREIYQRLKAAGRDDLIHSVCEQAKRYAMKRSGLPVEVFLVTSEEGVVAHV